MKKLLVILLILSMAISLAACGGPSDEEIKTVRSVSFEGRELTVTLGTNKSTGYEWDYEIYGECIELSGNNVFKITGSEGDATGEVSIGFEGIAEGAAVIVFTTPNGWDGTGEGDSYTVDVKVDADKWIVNAVGKDGANAPEPTPSPMPTPKTSVMIDELAEGTYTGTLSGVEYTTGEGHIFVTLSPADITVTIENRQVTLYCAAIGNADGILNDVETPPAPEFYRTVSGSLPLQQSGDAVIAEGKVPDVGNQIVLNHTDGVFSSWGVKEVGEGAAFTCDVHISMENGIPVATVTVGTNSRRTATVPLALASGEVAAGSAAPLSAPLSAPYAEMLKSGDYQYTYSLVYEGKPYTATIATYNGMVCRKVVSDDGTYSQRVVTIGGHAYRIDDLTGAVVDGGTENAETLPDYAASLTFVASKALETGAIGDAYDFEHQGQKCNLVFLFTPEGKLVALYVTVDEQTSDMEILDFSPVGNDRTLFDAPQ